MKRGTDSIHRELGGTLAQKFHLRKRHWSIRRPARALRGKRSFSNLVAAIRVMAGPGLSWLEGDLRAFALAAVKHDRGAARRNACARTPAMGLLLEAELAPPQFRPPKQTGGRRHDPQGRC